MIPCRNKPQKPSRKISLSSEIRTGFPPLLIDVDAGSLFFNTSATPFCNEIYRFGSDGTRSLPDKRSSTIFRISSYVRASIFHLWNIMTMNYYQNFQTFPYLYRVVTQNLRDFGICPPLPDPFLQGPASKSPPAPEFRRPKRHKETDFRGCFSR